MADMGQDVTFDIIARDRASSQFSKIGKSAKSSESALSKFGSTAKKVFAAAAIYQGAKTATRALVGMAKAAGEDQVSTALLAKQARNSADATRGQIAALEDYVDRLGVSKGITDDVARNSLGTLLTATHSVTKAQRLNNLAMNVAAARNKPLAAVSMAVAKAYNGSVGALGRLGIKTKDAAGKTLTFAAAQREMAKQFGGAAAAKAKSFTGVMDRFHVVVDEAGESVGYKLLPQLTKIVPKIAKFITGIQDGTGAGGRFADTVKTEILPVAANLATEAKLVYGALKPVFEILSKLPPQVIATGGAIALLGPKLGSMRAPLEANATGFEKFGRSVASLAGGAGLLAVADSANRSNQAMAGLQGALGGAAAGFAATGNPIGALVGGVGGGLLGVFSSGKKAAVGLERAAAAAAQARQDTDELAGSLDQVTAAYGKMTHRIVSEDLRKSGAFAAADQLGLSYTTLTRAALGFPGAVKKVQAAVDSAKESTRLYVSELQKDPFTDAAGPTKAQLKLAAAANKVASSLDTVADNTEEARRKILLTSLGAGEFAKTLKRVPESLILKIATSKASEAKAILVDLATRGKGLSDKQVRILLTTANLPHALADIKAIQTAADKAAKPRAIKFTISPTGNHGNFPGEPDGKSNDRTAGGSWMKRLADSITKGTPKVKVAIDRAKGLLDSLNDKLSSLKDTRAGFTSTFTSDSIFGADIDTTGTLSGLLKFQSDQANSATQLLADIRAVTSKGLSKGLVAQLQAAGSSGAAQLHLLAGASSGQIAQFNSLNAQTSSANQQGGLLLGNYERGGNIDSDIATARRDAAMVAAFEKALGRMKLEAKVKGGDLIIAVRATNHGRGRQPGDFTR